ncbi:hypothetical protein ACWEQG_01565 [Microbispora sp. NPDC004025]
MSVVGLDDGVKHGTKQGYYQHRYRKTDACDECKAALAEDRRTAREANAAASGKKTRTKTAAAPAAPITLTPPPALDTDRPHIGLPVAGRELEIGDVIVHLAKHYPIDRFEPYNGGLKGVLGPGTRVACSGTWGMTVGPDSTVRILPRPGGDA